MFARLRAVGCERREENKAAGPSATKVMFIHCVFVLFCFPSCRVPEPRANPMDPRDLEDNDSGPSMDHAP